MNASLGAATPRPTGLQDRTILLQRPGIHRALLTALPIAVAGWSAIVILARAIF